MFARWYKYIALLALGIFFFAGCVAVPIQTADKVVEKEKPRMFGFQWVDLTPFLAQDISLPPETKGILVIGVFKGFPAEAAGLREGDVVLKVNGQVCTLKQARQNLEIYKKISAPVVFEILRQRKTLNIHLEETAGSSNQYLLVQPPPNQAPRTLRLAADGSGDFLTVIGAFLASRPGDTILIAQGDYPKFNVNRHNLTIAGEARDKVTIGVIDASGKKGVKIKSLTVKNAVVIKNATGLVIENCSILKGYPGLWSGITKGEVKVNEPLFEDFIELPKILIPGCMRWRNGILVEIKNRDLPGLIQKKNSEYLIDLVTRIEKTSLGLSEYAQKFDNQAQDMVVKGNGDPAGLREMSVLCRQRIAIYSSILSTLRRAAAAKGR